MDDKQIIFILDDEKQIVFMLSEFIEKKLNEVEVYSFTNYSDLKKHKLLKQVSLFIFDINLENHLKGDEVALLIHEENPAPFLFMSGRGYTFESFSERDITYDYLSKPFDLEKCINRIKVLLKVSKTYVQQVKESENFKLTVKELFDATNIYLLILDINLKVKVVSNKLAIDLGYKNEDELIGVNWLNHLTKIDSKFVKTVMNHLIANNKEYKNNLREITHDIVKLDKNIMSVKWFNSRVSNGSVYSFSMGIPLKDQISSADDMATIRAHWRDLIDKNTTTIKTLIKSRI